MERFPFSVSLGGLHFHFIFGLGVLPVASAEADAWFCSSARFGLTILQKSFATCLNSLFVLGFLTSLDVVRSTAIPTACGTRFAGHKDGLAACSRGCHPCPCVVFTHFDIFTLSDLEEVFDGEYSMTSSPLERKIVVLFWSFSISRKVSLKASTDDVCRPSRTILLICLGSLFEYSRHLTEHSLSGRHM
jgi:hypothetical protein